MEETWAAVWATNNPEVAKPNIPPWAKALLTATAPLIIAWAISAFFCALNAFFSILYLASANSSSEIIPLSNFLCSEAISKLAILSINCLLVSIANKAVSTAACFLFSFFWFWKLAFISASWASKLLSISANELFNFVLLRIESLASWTKASFLILSFSNCSFLSSLIAAKLDWILKSSIFSKNLSSLDKAFCFSLSSIFAFLSASLLAVLIAFSFSFLALASIFLVSVAFLASSKALCCINCWFWAASLFLDSIIAFSSAVWILILALLASSEFSTKVSTMFFASSTTIFAVLLKPLTKASPALLNSPSIKNEKASTTVCIVETKTFKGVTIALNKALKADLIPKTICLNASELLNKSTNLSLILLTTLNKFLKWVVNNSIAIAFIWLNPTLDSPKNSLIKLLKPSWALTKSNWLWPYSSILPTISS